MPCVEVTIDTRMLSYGGIGTYIRNLLPYLQLQTITMNSPIYSLREQFEYSKKIPPCRLFWSPHLNVPFLSIKAEAYVVTIHDVFHLDMPCIFPKRAYAKFLLKKVVQKAAHIITVSEFSRGRILHYFPEAKEKITVIFPGADHLLTVHPLPVPTPPSFFLAVGSKKAHKNLAFIRDKIPNLVIVDKAALSLENLCWLYTHAKALIFPSLYEGWGFPPLEAMSLGCPVLASNAASIPEACGQAALFFNPYSFADLEDKISKLPLKREKLIAKGKARAAQFTWKQAAKQHADLFGKYCCYEEFTSEQVELKAQS